MAYKTFTTNNGVRFQIDLDAYLVRETLAWTVATSEKVDPDDVEQTELVVAPMVEVTLHTVGATSKTVRDDNGRAILMPDWDNAILASDVEEWPMGSRWDYADPSAETLDAEKARVADALGIDLTV